MPKKTVKIPAYRHHKGSGQALVYINGARRYLGKYDSEKSHERYRRLVAELLAAPIALPKPGKGCPPAVGFGSELEVVQIGAAYWQFAEGYYIKNGRPTGQLPIVRRSIRILRKFYAQVPAVEFGPLAMRAIQGHLVELGLARRTINHMCGTIKHIFKWAASHEMIPVAVYQALATVPGLRKGRTAAREPEPVGPVAGEVIDATLPSLPPVVADMVRFQRLTGCRPGEACIIRPCDVDTSAPSGVTGRNPTRPSITAANGSSWSAPRRRMCCGRICCERRRPIVSPPLTVNGSVICSGGRTGGLP